MERVRARAQIQALSSSLPYSFWTGLLVSIILLSTAPVPAQGQASQYSDTRCICVCPEPNLVVKDVKQTTNRTVYIPAVTPPPSECTCEHVVVPNIRAIIDGKEGEFCPRCSCKYSRRNTTIIQVVVIIVIWIVSLLMIYMLFLMCLEPLLNKRIKSTAYTEHTNEDEEGAGEGSTGGRASHTIRMTTSPGAPAPSSVLNRVGHQQSKWKRQVQEQRRNIYDRHTMLN